jgi:septum formation protein
VIEPVLVLASTSPRRRDLLALGGWRFNTRPADVDESQRPGERAEAYVLRLAESKARACASSNTPSRSTCADGWDRAGTSASDGFDIEDVTILAADTAVVNGETILGKPKDPAEAVEILRELRGHSHQVLTGIVVLSLADGTLVSDLCITDVPMREYSDDEIKAYVASGDPIDKAGAYAIQHAGFHPVEGLGGCYASVMGLPLCHLTRSLLKIGITPNTDIAAECQSALAYACPISSAVLRGEMVG